MAADGVGAFRTVPAAVVVAVAALSLLSLCPLWLPHFAQGGFWAARALGVLGGIAAVMAIGRKEGGQPTILACPAITLPLLALGFYSLIPAVYTEWHFGGPFTVPAGADPKDLHDPDWHYVAYAAASTAEAWVLAFSGIGLLLAMAFDRVIPARTERTLRPLPMAWGVGLIVCAGAAFQVGKELFPGQASSLVDSLPALVLFGVALLFQGRGASAIRQGFWVLAGLAAALALLYPHQSKIGVLFSVTLLLLAILRFRGWARVMVFGVLLASPLLGAGMVMFPRGVVLNPVDKIVYRQAESVFCLNFALREAVTGGGEWRSGGPFYFAAGLVPRVLWPDKPSLSHGSAFGKFCGTNIPRHSSSITLLGEPALRGGLPGTMAQGLVLAALSAAIIAAWKRGSGITAALALALSPWLIDFDQHFAMYVANLARGFLAALPFALLAGRFVRGREL